MGDESKELVKSEEEILKELAERNPQLANIAWNYKIENVDADQIKKMLMAGVTYGKSKSSCVRAVREYEKFCEYCQLSDLSQIRWPHIESYYNYLLSKTYEKGKKLEPVTVLGYMNFLKSFFSRIKDFHPNWVSPFDVMPEQVSKKIYKKQEMQQKESLTLNEYLGVLSWYEEKMAESTKTWNEALSNNPKWKEAGNPWDYCRKHGIRDPEFYTGLYVVLVFTFHASLRPSDVYDIKWKQLKYIGEEKDQKTGETDYMWNLHYYEEKRDRYRDIKINDDCIKKCKEYYWELFNKEPGDEDFLFYEVRQGKDGYRGSIEASGIADRMRNCVKELKSKGIIRECIEFSPNLTRRSSFTYMQSKGLSLSEIKRHSGHARTDTLDMFYVKPNVTPSLAFKNLQNKRNTDWITMALDYLIAREKYKDFLVKNGFFAIMKVMVDKTNELETTKENIEEALLKMTTVMGESKESIAEKLKYLSGLRGWNEEEVHEKMMEADRELFEHSKRE